MGKPAQKSRMVKVAGKDVLWILDHVNNANVAADHLAAKTSGVAWGKGLCVACKGAKLLCGKTRCPLIVRLQYYFRTMPLIEGTDVDGASPPGVFVGRIGYPYVYAGPLVPPVHEDTSLYDLPEYWFGKSIDEIVGFRSMLIRGKHRVHVRKFEDAGKVLDNTRELALAAGPIDVELALKKRPSRRFVLDDGVQPFGPSAVIRDLNVDGGRWHHQIEKAYGDTDLKAADAVLDLYGKGVFVSRIQRALQGHDQPDQDFPGNQRVSHLRVNVSRQPLRDLDDSRCLELRSYGSLVSRNGVEPQ